jgi:hypothetical protein
MTRLASPLLLGLAIAVAAVGCGSSSHTSFSSPGPTVESLVVQVKPGTTMSRESQLEQQFHHRVKIAGDFSIDAGLGRPIVVDFATKQTPAEMAVIERQILGMTNVRSVALGHK